MLTTLYVVSRRRVRHQFAQELDFAFDGITCCDESDDAFEITHSLAGESGTGIWRSMRAGVVGDVNAWELWASCF
jgi:hypothetical protein